MSDAKGSVTGAAGRMLTPSDIQQKEFRVSRFGGYKMRDVDEFLDEITDSLSSLIAEVERLRAHAGSPPVVGAPDLDDTARQADEIIGRAREQAARIVAEARDRSAKPTAGVASTVGRAAVGGFLAEEREFLQNLAGLVQRHAETVKEMARAARDASSTEHAARPQTSETPSATAPPPASGDVEPVDEADSESDGSDPPRAVTPEADPTDTAGQASTVRIPTSESPVRVEEPSPAVVARPDTTRGSDADEGSLKELFWGEE